MSMNLGNSLPGISTRNISKRAEVGAVGLDAPEIGDSLSGAPGTDGKVVLKRDHSDDVSDPDSPKFNPSDPDFDPDWKEENALRHGGRKARRNDSTGTGGISGINMTGDDPLCDDEDNSARGTGDQGGPQTTSGGAMSPAASTSGTPAIHSARQVVDGLTRIK